MAPMGLSWQIGSGEMSDRKHNKLAATLVRHMRADGMNVTVRDFDGKTRVIATCDGERIEATAVTPYRAAIEVMKLGGGDLEDGLAKSIRFGGFGCHSYNIEQRSGEYI